MVRGIHYEEKILIVWVILYIICLPSTFAQDISFTEEELMFIQDHPIVTIGVDPHFVPF